MSFTYSFYKDDDWRYGVFDTVEEIMKEISDDDRANYYDHFYLAEAEEKSGILKLNIEYALELALDDLELCESVTDNFSPSVEHLKMLEKKVNEFVADWQKETGNLLRYYTVHNVKKINLL